MPPHSSFGVRSVIRATPLLKSGLAALYADGLGVPRDYAEALKWFRRAADQGNARAQFNIGTIYFYGQGVPQAHADAVKWFRLAADQRYVPAQFSLGTAYAEGQGVPRNDAEAAKSVSLGC